jgi:hypothetical protein
MFEEQLISAKLWLGLAAAFLGGAVLCHAWHEAFLLSPSDYKACEAHCAPHCIANVTVRSCTCLP